jgi:hypothetical protein
MIGSKSLKKTLGMAVNRSLAEGKPAKPFTALSSTASRH